jgi:HAD superfamily hydrolase (TIGR01484 family)
LVATDVDGTLLNPHERVSGRTAAALAGAAAAGVPVVLATGRPPRWIPPVTDQLGLVRLAVCANGGVLYDVDTSEVLWSRSIPPHELVEVVEVANELFPGCRLAIERAPVGPLEVATDRFLIEAGYLSPWPGDDHGIVDRAELLAVPAVKLLIRCPWLTSQDMLTQLAPKVSRLVDLTFSHSGGLIEIGPPGVTKATGLAEVARLFDVDASDVVAFGDMVNDVEMITWAGHGVAMGNAHPALLAVADEVTASNADDGLAVVLGRWFGPTQTEPAQLENAQLENAQLENAQLRPVRLDHQVPADPGAAGGRSVSA